MAMLEKVREAVRPDDTVAKQQLEFLNQAAKGQLERFRLEFNERLTNPAAFRGEILPTMMISFQEFYRVDLSEESSAEVGNIVSSFLTGEPKVMDGFKEMAKLAFNTVLGNMSIGEEMVRQWFVTMEFGALIRVDMLGWRYGFNGTGVIASVKNAFCFTAVKSFADTEGLKKSQLGYFIARSLNLPGLQDIMSNETLRDYLAFLEDQQFPTAPRAREQYIEERTRLRARRSARSGQESENYLL